MQVDIIFVFRKMHIIFCIKLYVSEQLFAHIMIVYIPEKNINIAYQYEAEILVHFLAE